MEETCSNWVKSVISEAITENELLKNVESLKTITTDEIFEEFLEELLTGEAAKACSEATENKIENLKIQNERLTNLNRYLSDHLGDLIDNSQLLEDVRTTIDFESFTEEEGFEDRVKIKSVDFEDMNWKVTYELDGIEWVTEFDFEFCGKEDLPDIVANHIIDHATSIAEEGIPPEVTKRMELVK